MIITVLFLFCQRANLPGPTGPQLDWAHVRTWTKEAPFHTKTLRSCVSARASPSGCYRAIRVSAVLPYAAGPPRALRGDHQVAVGRYVHVHPVGDVVGGSRLAAVVGGEIEVRHAGQ